MAQYFIPDLKKCFNAFVESLLADANAQSELLAIALVHGAKLRLRVDMDDKGVKDVIGLAKPKAPLEPELPKVDMWDGWEGERVLAWPIIHGYGKDYQALPHTDVIKCEVESLDKPKGDKPWFLTPTRNFAKCSEGFATIREAKAALKARYEHNNRGKANGQQQASQ
jgi:hypothetical protein